MLKIELHQAGKRYNRDWIFRKIDYTFSADNAYAIIGHNGSGKSTLLQCIAGAIELKEGQCSWMMDHQTIDPQQLFQHGAIAAPYLDLIEEMTAKELLRFHHSFKPFMPNVTIEDILEIAQLSHAKNKQIRYYSSGMKQRLKLAQAIFSDVSVLLLDEPCTNLDKNGVALYQELIKKYGRDKLIIVSSNDPNEYSFCNEIVDIQQYK